MQLSMELRAREFLGRRNNNLHADGKIPDVEFQKNGETWVLDVRFTKLHNEEESFASKTDKYQPMYKNRVIPVVIGYSGKIYYKSKQFLKEHLPINRRLFNEAYLSLINKDNSERKRLICEEY